MAAAEQRLWVQGRHFEDLEMVIHEKKPWIMSMFSTAAASVYPLILQIRTAFGSQAFGAKSLTHATGLSRATAHRQIDRLYRAGAIQKRGYGEYCLAESLRERGTGSS